MDPVRPIGFTGFSMSGALRNFIKQASELEVGQRVAVQADAARGLTAGTYVVMGARAASDRAVALRLARVLATDPELELDAPVTASYTSHEARDHLGFALPRLARSPSNVIPTLLKSAFTKGKHPEFFDPSFNYDGYFRGLASKQAAKFGKVDPADVEDMIMDALMAVTDPKTIGAIDPSKGKPIQFITTAFVNRMTTALMKWKRRSQTEQQVKKAPGDERSDEEVMDSHAPQHSDDPVSLKELMGELAAYLTKQPNGARMAQVMVWSFQGLQNQEMARRLGVSDFTANKVRTQMVAGMLAYAKLTDNDLLASLLTSMANKKKSADGDDGPDIDFKALGEAYRKRCGAIQDRAPSGKVTQISVTSSPDMLSDKQVASIALADGSAAGKEAADAFIAYIAAQDDVIEDGEDVIGLRVKASDARAVLRSGF